MKSTPRTPPQSAIRVISTRLGLSQRPSSAHKKRAGIVKIAPAASDSPAEPIVCTRLLSRMEFFFMMTRITPIEITAAGMDAETVIPTRSPRYALAAPNTIARMTPMITDVTVISAVTFSAGIYGLNSLFSFIDFLSLIFFGLLTSYHYNRLHVDYQGRFYEFFIFSFVLFNTFWKCCTFLSIIRQSPAVLSDICRQFSKSSQYHGCKQNPYQISFFPLRDLFPLLRIPPEH